MFEAKTGGKFKLAVDVGRHNVGRHNVRKPLLSMLLSFV